MTPRTAFSTTLAWIALVLAIAQTVIPVVPFLGGGSSPDESTTDLLITPAGYAFSIWGLIYALSIAFTAVALWKKSTGTQLPNRVLADLIVAFGGATVWILVTAAEWTWVRPIVLTIMTVVLIDALRVVARPVPDRAPEWLTFLARATVGIYAAWATAAVFQDWAAAIGEELADPEVLGWQLTILILCALVGVTVTVFYGAAAPLYPVVLVWAFVAIIVAASGQSTAVVVAAVAAIVGLIIATVASFVLHHRKGDHELVAT